MIVLTFVIYFKFLKKPAGNILVDSSKYIFITGCDSGFGFNTAKQLDSLGFTVIATCLTDEGQERLRESCSKNLNVIKLDVTDSKQVQAAYDYVQNTMKSEKGKREIHYALHIAFSTIHSVLKRFIKGRRKFIFAAQVFSKSPFLVFTKSYYFFHIVAYLLRYYRTRRSSLSSPSVIPKYIFVKFKAESYANYCSC